MTFRQAGFPACFISAPGALTFCALKFTPRPCCLATQLCQQTVKLSLLYVNLLLAFELQLSLQGS